MNRSRPCCRDLSACPPSAASGRARDADRSAIIAVTPSGDAENVRACAPATASAPSRSCRRSVPAAWARCGARATRGSAARWRSRSCRCTSTATPTRSPASRARRAPSPRSRTPTSSPSTTSAEQDGVVYAVTELLEGETLGRRLEDGRCPPRKVRRLGRAGGARARRRPRPRHRPPRRQARQPLHHPRRAW